MDNNKIYDDNNNNLEQENYENNEGNTSFSQVEEESNEPEQGISVNVSGDVLSRFTNSVKFNIIVNAVLIVLGLIICFFPQTWVRVCGICAGLLCIINAAGVAYQYVKRDGAKLFSINMIFGLFIALVGILLIFYPYSTIDTVLIFLGIYLIICGLLNLNYGVWFIIGKIDLWLICLVVGLMLVAFGVLVIINPFVKLSAAVVTGLFFIFHSILEITISYLFINRKNSITEVFW